MTTQSAPKVDPRFTDRALMGRVWWWLLIGPAVKLAELQGWLNDRKMRHNFGEVE